MQVYNIQMNHMETPLGFDTRSVTVSWKCRSPLSSEASESRVRICLDSPGGTCVYESPGRCADSLGQCADFPLLPRRRYYVEVQVTSSAGDSDTALSWFETGKRDEPWIGQWITPRPYDEPGQTSWFEKTAERSYPEMQEKGWDGIWRVPDFGPRRHPLVRRSFVLQTRPVSARMYMTAMGAYELYVNGARIGNEYLAPGFTDYRSRIQAQALDITDQLKAGKNTLGVLLGKGWGRGRYGADNIGEGLYFDTYGVIAELHVQYEDGSKDVIASDDSWLWTEGPVLDSGIYDGEVYDANAEVPHWAENECDETAWKPMIPWDCTPHSICDRQSPPVRIQHTLQAEQILHTPDGGTVIDIGQNIAGFLRIRPDVPKGTRIRLQFGEWLEDGCFYRGNLHNALQEYIFVSDGSGRWFSPHFTFFGFRYVRVENWEPKPSEVMACSLYSQMTQAGEIHTSDPLLNRLFQNVLWSQRDNFVDIPTDCPQRSERQGWTGDAQVFSGTALFNTDCAAFYLKYLEDVHTEQAKNGGCVPDVVPDVRQTGKPGSPAAKPTGACGWGDVSVLLPWNLYLYTGDISVLRRSLPGMRAWVTYVKEAGVDVHRKDGWLSGMHYGDWLALDGETADSPLGGTEVPFLAAAYHLWSARILAQTLQILGEREESEGWDQYAQALRLEMQREYYSEFGRPTMDTQTFYVITLHLHICREEHRRLMVDGLVRRLTKDGMQLKTGFLGTPLLCRVLSEGGRSDLAWRLLLNRACPGWLYPVTMGATTVWERWNSILPDGHINRTGMNSLNHYSYGSIVEWMYRHMAGIRPCADAPGFRRFLLRPEVSRRVKSVSASYESASGLICSSWRILDDGRIEYSCTVPFGTHASLLLPFAGVSRESAPEEAGGRDLCFEACENGAECLLSPGSYRFVYTPLVNVGDPLFDADTPMQVLMDHPAAWAELTENSRLAMAPAIPGFDPSMTLKEACALTFIGMPMTGDFENLLDRLAGLRP